MFSSRNIVPESVAGPQFSFNFTKRLKQQGMYYMKLIIYFDASYSETLKTAGLAFIVKDEYDKILHKFSEKIFCKNSCDAELRALNKAIGFILAQQTKCLIPKGSTIIIYGENKSVIEISKNMKHIRKFIRV